MVLEVETGDSSRGDVARFSFRPALLRAAETVAVDDEGVGLESAEGDVQWRLRWRDISQVALVDFGARGMHISRFDLIAGSRSKRRSVSCTVGASGKEASPDFAAFSAAKLESLRRLAGTNASVPVTFGEHGPAQLAGFIIGLVCVMGALVIGFGVLVGARSRAVAGETMIPLLVLFAFGTVVTWSYAPWRQRPVLPVGAVAHTLNDLDKPEGGLTPRSE